MKIVTAVARKAMMTLAMVARALAEILSLSFTLPSLSGEIMIETADPSWLTSLPGPNLVQG